MIGKNYKFMEWLLGELPSLRENALIDQATEERLRGHYRNLLSGAPSPQQYLASGLAVFGACLISLGVILLIAFNWDMLPKSLRIVIAFLPLLGATTLGLITIIKNKDNRWREASAVGVMAGVVTLTSLISQIYHLSGTLESFMALILAVTFPLLYIFRSYAFAVLYCFGLFFLVGGANPSLNLVYLLPLLPFLIWHLLRGDINGYPANFSRWLLLPAALFWAILMKDGMMFGFVAFAAMFYAGGIFYRDRGIHDSRNPWLFLGWLGMTMLLLFGAYFVENNDLTLIMMLPPFLIAGFLTIRYRSGEMAVGMLAMILFFFCIIYVDDHQVVGWLCHAVLLGFGIFLLIQGIRHRQMGIFNNGMAQVGGLALYRFFSEDFDLFWRALGFIALGVIFVVINIVVGRVIKGDKGEAQ